MPLAVPPYNDPRGIAVDPEGNIYVAEYTAHRIIQLTPGGTLLADWDPSKGFTALYSVPHMNTGPLGAPTGVAYDPPGKLFVSTVCMTGPICQTGFHTPDTSYGHDVLMALTISGQFTDYVGNFWFGLGYSAAGAPLEMPGKESEVYVHIDAMAGDGKGHDYLAGTLWPRGGQATTGVISYTDLGQRSPLWPLADQSPVAGVAVDGAGAVYVSQGARVLKHTP
jgi:hypothetical protein